MDGQLPDDLVPLPTAPWDERPTELPLDVDECRTALWLTQGNIAKAAELIKVPSSRMRSFVNKNEFLKREMEECREVLKDIAEGNVYEALTDRSDTGRRDSMSRFVLERLGKDRGFGSGSAGVTVGGIKGKITVSWDTEPEDKTIDVTPNKVANG